MHKKIEKKSRISYLKVRNKLKCKESFMKAVVTSKGQVTIPASIRDQAHITSGTKLDFQIESDGTLRVTLINQDITALKGMLKSKNRKPVSLKEMKQAIRERAKERFS